MTASMLLAAAKSMYLLAFSVVAPWRSSIVHVSTPKCIPHQIPTYFMGLIQSVVSSAQGSFKFRIRPEFIKPTASLVICIVRQGVVTLPPAKRAFIPSGHGANSDLKLHASVCFKVISGKSVSAASWILAYMPLSVLKVIGVLAVSTLLIGKVR